MALTITGTIGWSGGLTSAILKQARSVNLKPVKRVVFKFDPFHPHVEQTRYFLYYMNTKRIVSTNLQCAFKTEIVSDRSSPSVTFKLVSGQDVVFKAENLMCLEMLSLYNKHISVLVPKEDPVAVVATKSTKSASVKKLNKKR